MPFASQAPLYYFPGFGIIITQYIVGFVNPKAFRIVNWVIEPFVLGIIVGLLYNNDIFAIISVILVPVICYSYIITLVILKRKSKITIAKEEPEEIKEEVFDSQTF